MNDEEWRPIPSWPGYEASSLGRIRGLDLVEQCGPRMRRRAGRVLKLRLEKRSGRYVVALSRNGEQQTRWVHILVAEAFHGPRPEGLLTRHRNDDRLDNRAANLTYGTKSDNWHDAARNGIKGLAVRQEFCNRGHRTEPPNRTEHQACTACNRATIAVANGHGHGRTSQDLQVVADLYYADIMGVPT
jgi:hypothetical protein